MRQFKIAAPITTALAMLAVAAVALASSQFKQTSNVTLTATKAGQSTGFKAAIQSSDPGEPGGKPQALKTLTLTLPSATKFNFKSKALTLCTAGDTEIKGTGGAVCPAKSKIGSGTAEANGYPAIPQIPENATAYAGKGNIIFLLAPKGPAGAPLVLHGVVSANKVTTEVPPISFGGVSIVITGLNLTVNKVGSGKTAFITAGKCTSGKFKVKSNFLYSTGATETLSSSSKCSK
jgi:hypothetical protein